MSIFHSGRSAPEGVECIFRFGVLGADFAGRREAYFSLGGKEGIYSLGELGANFAWGRIFRLRALGAYFALGRGAQISLGGKGRIFRLRELGAYAYPPPSPPFGVCRWVGRKGRRGGGVLCNTCIDCL